MPVREFTDSRGVEWRVWDVTPAHLHPITLGEDYMADFQDGWLAFEAGPEKRRLEAPYPKNWMTAPLGELEELCRRASVVIRRRPRSPSGEQRAVQANEMENAAIREAGATRTFRSPRGREWTVRVHECLDPQGAPQMVLRFTADDLVVELSQWPEDWRDLSATEYAMLLLDANPPRRRKPGEGPQRRHDDHAE